MTIDIRINLNLSHAKGLERALLLGGVASIGFHMSRQLLVHLTLVICILILQYETNYKLDM